MPVEFKDVETTDYYLLYCIQDIYVKANCTLKNYANNQNSFEASEILPGMYLGSINSVYDIDRLKELGITHIISVIAGFTPPYTEDFNYLVLNAMDTTNTDLSKHFDYTNSFIDEAFNSGSKILIHCMAGRSRSATILAAYIIHKFGIDYENTIRSIKSKRCIVEPNSYFVEQLNEYYKNLYTKDN